MSEKHDSPKTAPLLNKRQLSFAIEKLLNVISRRQRDLRNKCLDVDKQIKALKSDPRNGDRYWLIFQMSCESQVPSIVEVALDCIQKLMAASILTGQTQDRQGKPLIDAMVKTICDCCAIESEKVHLQIVKAILTLGTSPVCEVHGQSLLLCLRACYNIFLSTKNIDVQTSAKAVLTQIVCAVFQKMEKTQLAALKKQASHSRADIHLMCRSIVVGLANEIDVTHRFEHILPFEEAPKHEAPTIEHKENAVENNTDGNDDKNENKNMDEEDGDQKEVQNAPENAAAEEKEKEKEEPENEESADDNQQSQPQPPDDPPPKKSSSKSSLSMSPKSSVSFNMIKRGKFGWCVLCGAPASHYCIQTRDPVCSLDCKMANLKKCIDFLRPRYPNDDTLKRLELAYKSTVLTNDGHILFRALCRQALKTLPTDNVLERDSGSSWLDFKIPRLFDPHSAMKPLALKSKVLSLELLRLVFSNTGHTFKASHRFIDAVRECFVPVVTENAVSTVENIFQLAVNMFALLVDGYRKHLKSEIGVLLNSVFLQIAESPHSNFKQKKMALTVFNKICRDPQVLIGIFLNYDCGHEHDNIFQRVIDLLEKICSAKSVNESLSWSPQLVESVELRRLAIEILVNVIRYFNEWVIKANKSNAQAYEHKFHNKGGALSAQAQAYLSAPSVASEENDDDAQSCQGVQAQEEVIHALPQEQQQQQQQTEADTGDAAVVAPTTSSVDDVRGASASNASDISLSASQHLQRYAEKKKNQQNLLNAVLKFNLKPKEGIKYLVEEKIIADSVDGIVDFLINTPSLNKTQIGDYLGGAKKMHVEVMHAFVDRIDFNDLGLDEGIRRLCTHFKLPGEAAQIDRIMQKFAEKYCLQNEGIFKQADDAYILSYAIIMLNVALHHPQIKKRMTKEEFGRNNLLAVTDKSLLPLMNAVYDRIAEREILLDDKAAAAHDKSGTDARKAKQETAFAGFAWMNGLFLNQYASSAGSSYLEQRKNIMETVHSKVQQVSLKRHARKDNLFYEPQCDDVDALQPMFSICWLASLATFSVLLEDASAEILLQQYQQSYYKNKDAASKNGNSSTSGGASGSSSGGGGGGGGNDKNIYSADQLIGLCLNGYRYGIKLASNLGMDVEAESYVNSLASLTLLGTDKIMQQKNIEAIKTLLKIADEEGNILRKSWVQILKCVSELDVLHLIRTNAPSEANMFLPKNEADQIYGMGAAETDAYVLHGGGGGAGGHAAQRAHKHNGYHAANGSGSGSFDPSNLMTQNKGNKYQLRLARKQQKLSTDGIIRYGADEVSQQNVATVTIQIDQSMIDKIYADSTKLDSEGIVHFSVGLSCVSAMELDNPLNPRVFSLRKIVEVSHDNINLRIPLIWQRIWNVLSLHFVKAGCHNNTSIGAYAINSLRQLALLFLEKEELANFQFQNKFLLPFQHIMERTKSQEIRLLIVECIFRIVKARFNNVKSGWKTVFSVLGIAAKDPHEELSSATFKITEQILKDYFPLLKLTNSAEAAAEEKNDGDRADDDLNNPQKAPQILAAETLDECVNCLVSFSGNIWTDISLKAITNLVLCAQHLYDLDHGMKLESERNLNKKTAREFHPQKESPMIKAWFLCLTGLSRLIFDERIEVRGKSLEAMFQILQQHGAGFSSSMWELIFRGVLLPIFDDIYHNQIQMRSSIMSPSNQQIMHQLDTNWLESTGVVALAQLIALFTLFFTNCRFMLDKISLLLQSGINQLNEKTAKISVKCWKILIDGTAQYLNAHEWNVIIASLCKSMSHSMPFAFSPQFDTKCCEYQSYQKEQRDRQQAQAQAQLQHHRYPMPKYNKSVTSVQCMVHLIVLDQLFSVAIKYAHKLSIKQLESLVHAFNVSYKFARDFNCNTNFRNFLWTASHPQLAAAADHVRGGGGSGKSSSGGSAPDLFFQESRASSIKLETLLTLCSKYVPTKVTKLNMTADMKRQIFEVHKAQFMPKLYACCNELVESYCEDAAIEPFSASSSPAMRVQDQFVEHKPTPPTPSFAHLGMAQQQKNNHNSHKSAASKLFGLGNKNKNKTKAQEEKKISEQEQQQQQNLSAREYQSRRSGGGNYRSVSNRHNVTQNTDKGLPWKTGVIVSILDHILNDSLWDSLKEQEQFILNLYDYLILCIALDNRDIRQRISKLFGGCIKLMLMQQYTLKKHDNDKINDNTDRLCLDETRITSV